MGGCEDCRRKRRAEPQTTPPPIVVTVKKPANALFWYAVGLGLGWVTRGAFDPG